MSYLQRLFDRAPSVPSLASPRQATSPIVAADQRLALFPSLAQSFASDRPSGRSDTGEPGASEPTVGEATASNSRMQRPSSKARRSKAESRPASVVKQIEQPSASPSSPRASTLQRLVELDPLPAPASDAARSHRSAPRARVFEPSEHSVKAQAKTPAVLPPTLNVTADAAIRNAPLAEQAHSERLPTDSAPARPPAAEPAPVASRPAMEPAPSLLDQHAQALSGWLDALHAPRIEEERAVEREPERIIERIREVAAAGPPPRAMTAAGQSVIGSLSGSAWEPWQEWL